MAGNREYKSDVFSMLMEDRSRALQLYNAVNGSRYADPGMVELHNLDKGISLSVRFSLEDEKIRESMRRYW